MNYELGSGKKKRSTKAHPEVCLLNPDSYLLSPAILSPEFFYYQIIIQMRIFISTGEVSGDLQAAMLIESLFKLAKTQAIELEIFALGGDRMELA
ncbi:MAG: lipid-A-disaccharide synthase, partial [Microcystis sp. 53598_E5]|nr:lipid-A-disaccharide synthase [Microcystis sp. 53598_E5]